MTIKQHEDTWKEICFILSESISQKVNEKDFEGQVVRAVEALGWKEFKGEIKRQAVIKIGNGNKLIPDLVIYGEKEKPLIAIEVKKPTEDLGKDDVASQLQSYMRQLKTEFGLAIGNTVRFFYDGDLYPQSEPVLLDEIEFHEGSKGGQEFVSNINKDSMAIQDHTQYLKKMIRKVKGERDIIKLMRELESKEIKEKILFFLKGEFKDKYGSEIVEKALDSFDLQINRKITVTPPPPEPKPDPDAPLIQKVLSIIQSSPTGVSRKQICDKLSISGKQASNIRHKLMKRGQVRSAKKGIWVATHIPVPEQRVRVTEQREKKSPWRPSNDVNIREIVLKTIKQYKNGMKTAHIREKTGLGTKQLSNALYYLKKRDKIISLESGFYRVA
jgi:hypothetical protein